MCILLNFILLHSVIGFTKLDNITEFGICQKLKRVFNFDFNFLNYNLNWNGLYEKYFNTQRSASLVK